MTLVRNSHSTSQQQGIRVLLVAEGSGGHLIPALEVSRALVRLGASVMLLYAKRRQAASLLDELIQDAHAEGVQVHPVPLSPPPIQAFRWMWRIWQGGSAWRLAQERFRAFRPQTAVGFGGWLSVPVILAARRRRIPVLLHEQNVRLGRANEFLLPWADQMALSFPACPDACPPRAEQGRRGHKAGREQTRTQLNGTPVVITGLPIRHTIGMAHRDDAARRFGLDPHALTVFILGGSQGSRAINQLVCEMLGGLSWPERRAWQFLHLTGPHDHAAVQQAYAALELRCWVAPSLAEVEKVYALADVVVARAGASTIAELACVGKPAILIPYPHARGHQRANAQLVETTGAGFRLEEAAATPQRLLSLLRQCLSDDHLRRMMGSRMQTLAHPDATQQLASAIVDLAQRHV